MREGLHEFLLRVKGLLRRKRMNEEMADELAFHQEMLRAKLRREGVGAEAMEATVRRRFGNAGRWQERLRELWQLRRVENFARDVRFAVRLLAKSPGFTAVALLTLALGVGANTTVFSMINGLLLRPLPVPGAERLAVLGIDRGRPQTVYSFPEPLFRGLEKRHDVFATVFAFSHADLQVRGRDGNDNVSGQFVSGGFFPALETAPLLGRTLTEEDDRKGGNPAGFAAVISEGFRRSWFGGAADVVGRKLTIDDTVFTVVGVMPERFMGADPLERPAVWVPLATEPVLNGQRNMTKAGIHGWWLRVMGRLRPGVTVEQANAAVGAATSAILNEDAGDAGWAAQQLKQHFRFTAERGSGGFTYLRLQFRRPLVAVFAMCCGILLLACLNLTSLLMARGAARERELATRLAVGASRSRLTQQLMTESLLIAVAGTALGLAVAPLVSQALGAMLLSGAAETHLDTSLDVRVFGFAALVAMTATLVIGLAPALRATSKDLHEQIKSGQHTIQKREGRRWLPRVLMSVEVALALVLVVGAGLLASTLVRLYRSGAGFDPRGVENVEFSMEKAGLNHEALMEFYQQMGEGLRHVPGVTAVSFASVVPMTFRVWDEDTWAPGQKPYDVHYNSVSPDYFRTMRIPLLEGRDFRWNETPAEQATAILNEKAAVLLFPNGNALGQTMNKSNGANDPPLSYRVVGVVGNAKYEDLRSEAPPTAYLAMTQETDVRRSPSFSAVVRTSGDGGSVAAAARRLARQLAPGIPAPVMTSMQSKVDDSLSAERMMALLSVFFAACALLVTGIGLYGTLAYATARRTSEIGVRMALGARRGQVVGMVCGQNALAAVTGAGMGLIAALLGSKALASFLYGTGARDPWVLLGSVLALAAVASGASLLPALRASRIDPMKAIRCE
jgi:putative ABC transport system permease protein